MKRFIPIPDVESGLYIFGGHQHTVPGGWTFFPQKHQAFELMCILKGSQTTIIDGAEPKTYGPGSVMIIAPGTMHNNKNASEDEEMTYICFHFNFESLWLKSALISKIANEVIHSGTPLAKTSMETALEVIKYSKGDKWSKEQAKLKIQICLLNYLYDLTERLADFSQVDQRPFTEKEAKVARKLGILIEADIESNEQGHLSFGDICEQMDISSGYGHRTFKKVYGMTPLRFAEEKEYRKAKLLLGHMEHSIEDVAFMIGSNSISNFSKQFKKWSGMTPSEYRRQMTPKRTVRSIAQSGHFE